MKQVFSMMEKYAASGMILIDKEGIIREVNRAVCQLLLYPENGLTGISLENLTYQEKYEEDSFLKRFFYKEEQNTIELEKRLYRRDGTLVWVHLAIIMGYDTSTHTWYSLITVIDLTERKNLEAKLAALSQDKDILLQQVHQQVKHNLGLVDFLLHLQENSKAYSHFDKNTLCDCIDQLHSIKWIYSTLYLRERTSSIQVGPYLTDLIKQIFAKYNPYKPPHIINLSVEEIALEANQANSLGFIVFTLLSGIIKNMDNNEMAINLGKSTNSNQYQLSLQMENNGKEWNSQTEKECIEAIHLAQALTDWYQHTMFYNYDPGKFHVIIIFKGFIWKATNKTVLSAYDSIYDN